MRIFRKNIFLILTLNHVQVDHVDGCHYYRFGTKVMAYETIIKRMWSCRHHVWAEMSQRIMRIAVLFRR